VKTDSARGEIWTGIANVGGIGQDSDGIAYFIQEFIG
jgi:hypothetical protein